MKIIAVGNSFYGDDGVGAAVLDRIRQYDVFPDAELIDVHTDALALLDHMARGEKNVVVDAAQMGLEPGTAVGFRPSEVRLKIKSDHLSMHGFGLAEAFDLAAQLDRMPADVLKRRSSQMAEKTILVIDDDIDLVEIIRVTLENQGFKVIDAQTGERGLAMAKEQNPDLILLDVMMGKVDEGSTRPETRIFSR